MIDAEGLSFTYGSVPSKGSCHEDSDRHRRLQFQVRSLAAACMR